MNPLEELVLELVKNPAETQWLEFKRNNSNHYEEIWAKQDLHKSEVLGLLDYSAYFDLCKLPLPNGHDEIMRFFEQDNLVVKLDNGRYAITNLGALLFAKRLRDFRNIERKSVRVVQYDGDSRVNILRNITAEKGYASGFAELMLIVEGLLPTKEVIDFALRKTVRAYPPVAVRELIANALIHQDLSVTGAGPLIELFDSRLEISNPGKLLVEPKRIIDNPPRSRNEILSGLLRRLQICEELGSGWDRATLACEEMHLPAPRIEVAGDNTRVVLQSRIPYAKMSQSDKLWTCYLHTCVRYVNNEHTTNSSLRQCFDLPETAVADVSRLLKQAQAKDLVKPFEDAAPRYRRYVPNWA